MSEHISMSRTGEPGTFTISTGNASFVIDELRVQPSCNMERPHVLLGLGDSRLYLTDKQLCVVVGEWLRYTLCPYGDSVHHTQSSVAFNVVISKDPDK